MTACDENRVTFVCTGNICRSPMAEYLLRAALPTDGGWVVLSAGVFAGVDMPASRAAVDVLAEQGIDLTPHRSRPLTREVVDASKVIVVMTVGHREQVRVMFPDAAGKVFLLKSFGVAGGDVRDPIGLSTDVYRNTRDDIGAIMPDLTAFLDHLQTE